MDGEQKGAGDAARGSVDPFEDTAPQPVIHPHLAHPHHHEGGPGPTVSPAGHHVAPAAAVAAGRHEDRRRRTTLLVASAAVAALALVAAVGWALAGRGASTAAQPTTPSGSAPGASAPSASGSTTGSAGAAGAEPMLPASQPTLVLGDSLGLVAYPYLADLVPDRYVSYEAEVGRSTAGTVRALGELGSVPPVVIVSSGTNDGTAEELATGAAAILDALGAERCVVWVDVVRPESVGDTQEELNAALDTVVAGRANVSVLRWSTMVAEHPEWLAGDGIHPTDEGAQARARAYADASAACSPLDPTAPRAERQYLPDSAFWGPVSGSGQQSSSTQGSGGQGGGSGSASGSSRTSPGPSSSATSSRTPSPSTSSKPSPASTAPTVPAPPPSSSAPEPPPAETTAAAAPAPTS